MSTLAQDIRDWLNAKWRSLSNRKATFEHIRTEPKEFVGRQKAKRIAKKAGQANVRGRRGLHPRDIMK